MIQVLIADGGRHRVYSGYGDNARSFALALLEDSDRFQVQFLKTEKAWEYEGSDRGRLESIQVVEKAQNCDLVLQVGNPASYKRDFQKPSLFFTQCDLSDLSQEFIQGIKGVDGIITACRSAKRVFEKYCSNVYLTPLAMNHKVFRPVRRWRTEGPECFSFIFVGSFSFRKGVDLLIEAFFQEFTHHEVNLHIHSPGMKPDEVGNYILHKSRVHNKPPMFSFSTQALHPEWINRFYNRADAFVSFTRGEGWGMPIAEAMHCGLPVIAPLSTAMLDYLNKDVAFCLRTEKKLIDSIEDEFGEDFKKSHNTPGNSYYEVDVEEARKSLRNVVSNPEEAARIGEKGRNHMINNFSMDKFNSSVYEAILTFINHTSSRY